MPFAVVGGLIGGLLGALFAAATTELIKRLLAVVSRQQTWVLVVVPLVGLSLSVVALHLIGHGAAVQHLLDDDRPRRRRRWRAFPTDVIRADLTADVVASAGREERFPWHLAPVRAMAIVATVGLGAPMGTESPAAHLGMAAGAAVGDQVRPLRRLARPMALGGGAAAVAALMGLPLVGAVFVLELGRRRQVAISPGRVAAALAGGLAGWAVNVVFDLDLIRLVVPQLAPQDLGDALGTALLVGGAAGAVCAISGAAIYRARAWRAAPHVRLLLGGVAVATIATAIVIVAAPAAAVGPGGGAVLWAERTDPASLTLLAVVLLRAIATPAAVAAGGCGGVFVPFLAMGDLAGRMIAPAIGVSGDLAGAAGAAGGIAGGYRLPWTAAVMVLGIGGPYTASLTCLATVAVAVSGGFGVSLVIDRIL